MTMIGDGAWYVVQTQVNAEAKAARNLMRQGFEIYLPRYLKRRSHARKIEKVAAPLFPRYLFVCVDMEKQRWRSIQSTFGVSRLVDQRRRSCRRSHSEVVQFAARARRRKWVISALDPGPNSRVGDKVQDSRRSLCRKSSDCSMGWAIANGSRFCLTCWGKRFASRWTPIWLRPPETASRLRVARERLLQVFIRQSGDRESPGLR